MFKAMVSAMTVTVTEGVLGELYLPLTSRLCSVTEPKPQTCRPAEEETEDQDRGQLGAFLLQVLPSSGCGLGLQPASLCITLTPVMRTPPQLCV